MPRAMWSGVIGFGMVSIPIKLYSATENRNVSFHQLHSICKTRIREIHWCPTCDREVPWQEVEKGFEYSKGEYVSLAEEDLNELPIASKDAIEVSSFCSIEQIDPIYFEKHYYLEPEKTGKRPFHLFIQALVDKAMLGIASITLRTKERLCVLRPVGSHLLLSTLLYPDELRIDPGEKFAEHKVTKQELAMAVNLIDLLAEDFEPGKYEDRYRTALMKLIDAKLEGQPLQSQRSRAAQGQVVDLLDALRNSVSKVKSGAPKGKATPKDKQDENVVAIKESPKSIAKSAAKSAARVQKTPGIGRLPKKKAKAKAKKTPATRAKIKNSKRSA